MIEPTKAGKNATAACSLVRDEEEEDEDESKEEGAPATVEQISSIQESILSHTASMIMGPSGLQDEKDKQVSDGCDILATIPSFAVTLNCLPLLHLRSSVSPLLIIYTGNFISHL